MLLCLEEKEKNSKNDDREVNNDKVLSSSSYFASLQWVFEDINLVSHTQIIVRPISSFVPGIKVFPPERRRRKCPHVWSV